MEIKYICIGLLISFVLVLALWVLQRFFRKMKTLCLCSTIALIVVAVLDVLAYIFIDNHFLVSLAVFFSYPGSLVAAVFVKSHVSFDNFNPPYIILSYIFAVIFWSLAFWRIVDIIQYDRKNRSCSKTNGR